MKNWTARTLPPSGLSCLRSKPNARDLLLRETVNSLKHMQRGTESSTELQTAVVAQLVSVAHSTAAEHSNSTTMFSTALRRSLGVSQKMARKPRSTV